MEGRLLLENGVELKGVWRGAQDVEVTGEVVFNTSMMGYQEILTDPSYAGQIVTMTYPEIGNYGTNVDDVESSKIHCRALVVRELSEIASNFKSNKSLEQYLIDEGIACLSEVDTRALTRQLREKGAMKGTFLKSDEDAAAAKARIDGFDYEGVDWSQTVTGLQKGEDYPGPKNKKVAVLDFGTKSNILRLLSTYAEVEVFRPDQLDAAGLEAFDGFFLSNGPGDPAAVDTVLPLIRAMLDTGKPIFGICLGHQLLSLALGGKTFKLKFGHHGANHPVKNLLQDTVEVSSQNHGFAVDATSFPDELGVIPTHINLNDQSLAGLMLKDRPVYSIQYHPEAAPGPHDSRYLFDRFKADLGV